MVDINTYRERRAIVEGLDSELLTDMLAHETDPAMVGLITLVLGLRARRVSVQPQAPSRREGAVE